MNKRFLVMMAVVVAAFVGLMVFNKSGKEPAADQASSAGSNHIRGSENGEVTLLEFGDFQCPACAAYHPIIQQVKEKYGDQLTFRFRHYPLVSIHPNAMSAHRAAEAAAMQGKFWEMHDLLYERQSAWSSSNSAASIFEGYAEELELDMDKYKQDLVSSEIQAIINADLRAGQEAKITATPGFVLDGKKLEENPRDLEGFSKLIDEALAAKQQ